MLKMTEILSTPVEAVINTAKKAVSSTSKDLATVNIDVALSANDFPAVPSILEDISALSVGLTAKNNKGRLEVLEKARALVRALETPRETMIKHTWAQVRCLPFFINPYPVETGRRIFS